MTTQTSLGAATTAAAAVIAEDAKDRGPFWLKAVRVVVERGHPDGPDTVTEYVWRMEP
jgi:hypothetical protein